MKRPLFSSSVLIVFLYSRKDGIVIDRLEERERMRRFRTPDTPHYAEGCIIQRPGDVLQLQPSLIADETERNESFNDMISG